MPAKIGRLSHTRAPLGTSPRAAPSARSVGTTTGRVAVEARGLVKIFGPTWRPWPRRKAAHVFALQGVSLSVRYGEIVGLAGPNGSGKTTLLRILFGILLPTAGTASVGGHDLQDERAVKKIVGHATGDDRGFYGRLTGRQNLAFFGALRGLHSARLQERIAEAIAMFGMAEFIDRSVQKYSTGQRQRLSLARATLHDPEILLLDEPTRGLDPPTTEHVERWLAEWVRAQPRRAVLLVSHDPDQLERLSARVGILVHGRLAMTRTIEDIRGSGYGQYGGTLRQAMRVLMTGTIE
jgi:ABC-type multidrug transport system ATPase subunit